MDSLVSLLKILFSIEEDFIFNEDFQRQGLQLMLDSNHGCVLVAENKGQVIGMCSGQLTVSTAEGCQSLLVEDVVVHEDFRGKGIGRQLMDAIARWGKEHGASRLQLLADRNNGPALQFYKKIGWQGTELICLRKRNS